MSNTTIKFINEPVIEIDETGNKIPFIPVEITNGRQAYAASLNIIFKHIAEFHITVLTIIAEKYGLNVDEILEEVHKDDRYNRMSGVINNLGAFPESEMPVPEIQEPVSAVQEPVASPEPVKKVIRKRTIKPTKPETSGETELEESMQNMVIDEKPKKRVYKKKEPAEGK